MGRATVLRAIKQKLKVQRGSRAEITNLPFAPGTEIEVIVVGADNREAAASIYEYTQSLARKKRLPRYSMKQIEKIIHESRQSRG